MLIHRDGLIELNYDAATDILTVSWPDIVETHGPGLDYSFGKLVETIKYYDIKKLIIDSRFNKVFIQEEEYTLLVKRIHKELSLTRLEMAARLGSLDEAREAKASKHAVHIIDQIKPAFAFRNFDNANEALEWLKAG
jgi:hypothetical protein